MVIPLHVTGYFEATSSIVDAEVRLIIESNYRRAEDILRKHIDKLHIMAEALIKYETIGQDQIQDIMQGKPIREPASWRNKDSIDETNKPVDEKIPSQDDHGPIKLGDENQGTVSADGTINN